jgi:hypothetical protein
MAIRRVPLTAKLLAALESVVRTEMLVVLETSPELTVAELARELGRKPDGLYHHLRVLYRAGAILPRDHDTVRGRPAKSWTIHPDLIGFSFDLPNGPVSDTARKFLSGMARSAVRDFANAHAHVGTPGAHRPEAGRVRLWLSAQEGRKLDEAIKALIAPFVGRRSSADRKAFLYTWFFAPAVNAPPRGRAKSGKAASTPPQRRKRLAPAGRSPRR